MTHSDLFNSYRPYLFSIAYRMLGTVMDAEDLVQEAYLRWEQLDPATVRAPKSFLATIVTRLAIDQLRSAREQRERYIGPWLPEPLWTGGPEGESQAALAESLTEAFLLLLEQLSPTERAAFVLREVFDFPYAELAETLDKSPANCRQIVRRARQRLQPERRMPGSAAPHLPPSNSAQQASLAQLFQSVTTGDVEGLVNLLTEDAVLLTDSNGKVHAARRPIEGGEAVARFFLGIYRFAPQDFAVRPAELNGRLGLIYYEAGQPAATFSFDYAPNGQIQTIYAMRNPDKLKNLPGLQSA